MPVLYGVLLYMGVASLRGMQFIDRCELFFMPPKHQPDYIYLRHVTLNRVYLFTFIQVGGKNDGELFWRAVCVNNELCIIFSR